VAYVDQSPGPMTHRPTTVERAYQLAGSGLYANVGEIKKRLHVEGFIEINGQLFGPVILAALRRRCIEGRAALLVERP